MRERPGFAFYKKESKLELKATSLHLFLQQKKKEKKKKKKPLSYHRRKERENTRGSTECKKKGHSQEPKLNLMEPKNCA